MIKILRSLIHEYLPFDLRFKIELLSRRRDITNKEKQDKLLKLLREFNLNDFVQLGPGTNRYAFKLKGFVVKIATDNDGKIDNRKEFLNCKKLFPYVTKTYEISENATILIAEYIQPFISYGEMTAHASQIREILDKLSKVYLLGDVGITSKNFTNWGVRIGTDTPVCLDFAYVYDVSSKLFLCTKCNTNSMLLPDSNYTKLVCSNPGCRAEFSFEDIRRKLSYEDHMKEIGDLSKESYVLSSSNVRRELDPERSRYLMKQYKQQKNDSKLQESSEPETKDTFVMEHEPEYYINRKKVEENSDMDGNLIIEARMFGENYKYKKSVPTVSARPVLKKKEEELSSIREKPENITVIAKPIAKNTELAFSADVKEDISLEQLTQEIPNVSNVVNEVTEEKEAEIAPEEKNEVIPTTNNSEFIPQFVNNMHRAISKLSNKISDNLYDQELFDVIKPDLISDDILTGDFYKIVQNAIFRSITIFLDMEEAEVLNQKTGKNITIYKAPANINNSKYHAMLKFIERFWINRDINNLDYVKDIMEAYRKLYNDYLGLDRNWLPTFAARLSTNLTIADKFTIQKIVDFVANDWCDNSKKEEVVKADTEDTNLNDVTEELVTESSEEANKDNNEEDSSLISVEIYPNKDMDVIKLKYSDDNGVNTIPLNCVLSNFKSDTSSHKPIAGYWNWLSFITPDYVFETLSPETWIAKNYTDNENKFYKYAVIDTVNNSTIVGLYCLEGIYVNDKNNELNLTEDPVILSELNNVFCEYLPVMHLAPKDYILGNYEIHTEDELKEFLKEPINYKDESSIDDNEEVSSDEDDDSEDCLFCDPDEEEIEESFVDSSDDVIPTIADIVKDESSNNDNQDVLFLTPIRRK